jgi:hypothetical protein
MSLVPSTSKAQLRLPLVPTVSSGDGQTSQPTPRRPSNLRSRFAHSNRVLHDSFGLGQVLPGSVGVDNTVLAQFATGPQQVRCDSLRWLIPLTTLTRLAHETGRVTAWAVRKAHEQGTILPDVIGSFAGHKVHYYDIERLPALIEQLCTQDIWAVGALIMHSQFGPGKIVASPGPVNQAGRSALTRYIQFFDAPSPLSISVQELRHLLPSHRVASSLQSRAAYKWSPGASGSKPRIRVSIRTTRQRTVVCGTITTSVE